jgi:hypothetical protein
MFNSVYTQRSGYWAEGNQFKTENRYTFHIRFEIMTTASQLVRMLYRIKKFMITSCDLLGNSGTTTSYRFRLLSPRGRNPRSAIF